MDIEWSAGAEGIRQNVYWSEDGLILSIILTPEGMIIDLIDKDGEVIGTECADYYEMVEALKEG